MSEFVFAAGEPSKTLQTVQLAYEALSAFKMPRDGIIVALGGGVVGDLAGFVAGTWMRGLRWVYCPTTMEADVDACLGGKTAVNLPTGKNLVGLFHHPMLVAVDPGWLSTLPRRDICAGLAEAVKHAFLQSAGEVAWLETNAGKILALDTEVVGALIERNLRYKGRIVSEDPFEKADRRIILNFGHTIGHAIETCSEGALRHGECVALGMLAACRISQRAGLIGGEVIERLRKLLTRFDLPTALAHPMNRGKVFATMSLDKKTSASNLRLVFLNGIGNPVVRDDISIDWIADAFDSLLSC